MALTFEYEKDLQSGAQPFISSETDSRLYNYYINNELAMDKSAVASLGQYDNVEFIGEDRHLTTQAVSKIGIKNFPGIGGIGFYKEAYSENCKILAPIHVETRKYDTPILNTAEIVDDKLHVVITPPSNIEYACYRVVVKQDLFAFEYITYKTEYYFDAPTVKGDFVVYCIGYDEDNATVSESSNELMLTIENGSKDWSPAGMDTSSFEARLAAIEKEIANYPDDEISESVAEVIASV